ncbi:MAG: Imm10 family immunity protein [Crocinitomicaceae bacterium]|nr:Imm10 family immunity protein [Crocinitomicaceae bacterium]
MYEIKFQAQIVKASKNEEDQFYMIAIADSKEGYNNYVIFQKTFDPDEIEDDSDLSEVYVECNGESCYNCCDKIFLQNNELKFDVKGTSFTIGFDEVDLDQSFYRIMNFIFGATFIYQ